MGKIQIIIFGIIAVVVLLAVLILTGILPGIKPRSSPPFTLVIWGFKDAPEVWQAISGKYKEGEEENSTTNYIKKDPKTYETELVNALAAGQGPDIFLLQDSWLSKHRDKITLLKDGALGYQKKNLKNVFADEVAAAISDENGALLGTPIYFDTLALFFNRDYLNSSNIPNPPQTWEELLEQSKILTRLSAVGGIQRSGIALGASSNVEHAADAFLALLYQSGGKIIDEAGKKSALSGPAAESATLFYASFANPAKKTYSWNSFFDNSLQAFANGDTAMILGYAADAPKIAALNPQLNFDIAPLPQPDKNKPQINFGRFDLLTVSRTSKNNDQSWKFLLWLQSKDAQKLYIDAVGLPPSRRDLVSSKPPREYLEVFYDQVLSARAIPVMLGDSLETIINDMIDSASNRRFTIQQAISQAATKINAALSQKEE